MDEFYPPAASRHTGIAPRRARAMQRKWYQGRWKLYALFLAFTFVWLLAVLLRQRKINAPVGWFGHHRSPLLSALANRMHPAVVAIWGYHANGGRAGFGSGFFLTGNGVLLTCHHVLKGAASADVKMTDGTHHRILAVLADAPGSDLAEVVVSLDHDVPFLHIATQPPKVGEPVVAIRGPLGWGTPVTQGAVAVLDRADMRDRTPATLQVTARFAIGSSGGPVLDSKGEVIGVAAAISIVNPALNFAVPLKRIRALRRTEPIPLRLWSGPHRQPHASDLYDEGMAYRQLGDCRAGLRRFALALQKRPDFAAAWAGKGVCFFELAHQREATAALTKAVSLDPTLARPHYILGLIDAHRGEGAAARGEYETLRRLDPRLAQKLAGEIFN